MNKDLKRLIAETINKTFAEAPEKLIKRGIREIQYDICPHCKTEIYERHEYTEDGGTTWRHSDCKGMISRPETPIEKINDWLRPYVTEARNQRHAARKALEFGTVKESEAVPGMPPSGEEKYKKQEPGGTMSAVNLDEKESPYANGVNEMQNGENEESKPVGPRDFVRFANNTMNFVNASNVPLKVTVSEFTSVADKQTAKTYIVRVDNV
jgi:hypothetical protein